MSNRIGRVLQRRTGGMVSPVMFRSFPLPGLDDKFLMTAELPRVVIGDLMRRPKADTCLPKFRTESVLI